MLSTVDTAVETNTVVSIRAVSDLVWHHRLELQSIQYKKENLVNSVTLHSNLTVKY